MVSRWAHVDRESFAADHLVNVVGTLRAAQLARAPAPDVPRPVDLAAAGLAFERGLARHNAGEVQAAERGYRQALAIDPRHAGAAKYLGKIAYRAGDRRGTRRRLLPLAAEGSTDRVATGLFAEVSAALGVAAGPAPAARPDGAREESPGEPVGRLFRSDHFVGLTDRERARRLFKLAVHNVDLELFSYCNRRCLYCPNSFIDRISTNTYLPGPVYRMLVENLAEIDFRGKVVLNFYNEPMADPVTLEACREIRAMVPRASIRMNTNGDYLHAGSLEELRDAGLSYLMISLHVSATVDWDDDRVRFRAEQIYERVGRRPDVIDFRPGQHYRAIIPFEGMRVEVIQGNYNRSGYNIGGLMRHIPAPRERLSPCDEPFKSLTVTYNGNITPCCRIRGDADAHKPYVTGNLADYGSIFEAWASEALAGWRRHLLGFNPKAAPCHECKAVMVPDSAAQRQIRADAARLMPEQPVSA